MRVRRFEITDAEEVSALIVTTLRTTNIKDYSAEYIENDVNALQPNNILERASWMHFYVVCDDEKIVGCGAIGPYWGKENESSLFTIFVLPEYQGKGIGRTIIETLEQDEYFLRAKRVEIPASITGTPFYRKMGYDYKNGITTPDEEGLLRLEKHR
ncbi:TPA: GNAT family N-acetyltransferase [Streptococcus equi subsp. zooepidemicus]|nr:GNAT family N-acetyltransferase [Streptococcus equi subsp. zooepidemicus]